ncbi:hypothetical protein PLIIFM63780_002259 [Purpureocillium lilacinum]|nr:hypothetical protein PLIIFM63780_002259 [Purpureocillium lilacinum]
MKRYADVKQHILRYHSLNSFYYCSSCWEVWTKERPWQAHVQLRACTNILGPEHLLDEEADRLRTLETPRGLDDTRKWYCMWDELFRGHTRPVSPHVEDGIAEPAALLCRNGEAALRVDMPSLLRRYNITLDPEAMLRLGAIGDIQSLKKLEPEPAPATHLSYVLTNDHSISTTRRYRIWH